MLSYIPSPSLPSPQSVSSLLRSTFECALCPSVLFLSLIYIFLLCKIDRNSEGEIIEKCILDDDGSGVVGRVKRTLEGFENEAKIRNFGRLDRPAVGPLAGFRVLSVAC